MLRYMIRRLLFLVLTVFLTSVAIFILATAIPGDAANIILGQEATPEALAALRTKLGLIGPLHMRYLRWAGNFIQGDWGISLTSRVDVLPMVMERLGTSLKLTVMCVIMSIPTSIGLGVLAGFKRYTWVDNVISIGTLAFTAVPSFVTGMYFLFFLAVKMEWFPAMSRLEDDATFLETLHALFLPALTVTLVFAAHIARMTRASVIEVHKTDYVRTAVLKGLSRGEVIVKHILRNALIPTVTVIAMSMGWLVGGLIVAETVFSYPGLGRLLVWAIQRRDVPVVEAVSMLLVLVVTLSNLGADLLYAWLNPRVRLT